MKTKLKQVTWGFTVGDVENDGDIDIIVSSYRTSPRYHVLENDGTGRISIAWQSPAVPNYEISSMHMADLNGDGLAELITFGSFNHYNVWENNGLISGKEKGALLSAIAKKGSNS